MQGERTLPQGQPCHLQRAALFAALLAALDVCAHDRPGSADAVLGLLERTLSTPYDDLAEKFATLYRPGASREDRLYGAMLLYLCLNEPRAWREAVWVGPDLGGGQEGDAEESCLRLMGELARPEEVARLSQELSLVVAGLDAGASVEGQPHAPGQARFLVRP